MEYSCLSADQDTRLKRYVDELDSAESVILSLGLTIEARDPYTKGHCQRLAAYATALGSRLGLADDQLVALNRGAFLHDVGKIRIPDAVLLMLGRLPRRAAGSSCMRVPKILA
jgi:putative two-component system response regulator